MKPCDICGNEHEPRQAHIWTRPTVETVTARVTQKVTKPVTVTTSVTDVCPHCGQKMRTAPMSNAQRQRRFRERHK